MADITKTRQRLWVYPTLDCDCECAEEESSQTDCSENEGSKAGKNVYRLTYEIPGVNKKDIHLKVIKNGLRLVAHKDDLDYINEFAFQCDVDVKSTLAAYENGVLTIDAPYDCPDPFNGAGFFKIS